MSISKKAWTGLAREATPGTAPANATVYHPTKSKFARKSKYVYLNEDRGSRDGNNGRVASVREMTGDLTGAWYNDTSVYLLMGFMGGLASSQPDSVNAPTVWQQAMTLTDVPPSLAIFKSYDAVGYTFPYCGISKLVFKWSADAKELTCDATVVGQYGTKVTGALPSPTYGTVLPFAGYEPTIKLGGTQSQLIEDMTITLEQKVTPVYVSAGNRSFASLRYGERKATFDFTALFDDATLMDAYEAEAEQTLDVTFTGPLISGTFHQTLDLSFPITVYDDAEADESKDWIQIKCKGTAMPGNSLNSLFTGTVTNTVSSYAS